MKRISVVLLALALGLSACTSDDDPGEATSPSPTATSSPSPSPAATSEPDDEPDASPSPSPSPTETDGDDGQTDGETDDGGDTDAGATDGQDPDTDDDTAGGPASDTPSTAVSYDASGSAFVANTEQSRAADFSGACHVVAGTGETIHECVKLFSDVNNAWMGVVEAADDAGNVTVTVYRYDGTEFVSALQAPADTPDTYTLAVTDWENAEDLARATDGSGTDLLAWDRSGEPRLVARIPTEGSTTYTAQRVIRRTSDAVEVLAVNDSGAGLSGSSTPPGSEEDVALTLYHAWVRDDRAAAEGLATDEVLQELFEDTPATNDSYELNGTDCGPAGDQLACGFTATFDGRTFQLTWTIGTVDGSLQVVKLESSG